MKLKQKNILQTLLLIAAIVLINIILSSLFFRVDLTSDKRYTMNNISKSTMRQLDDMVYVRVYLDGEMPAGLKKLQQSIKETLDELAVYAPQKLKYQFINPSEGTEEERNAIYNQLRNRGLNPLSIQENDTEGGATQRIIFPAALVAYGGREKAVNFFNENPTLLPDENLNLAFQNIEFELVSAIEQLSRKEFPKIAFIEGHDELDTYEVGDLAKELSQFYKLDRVTINGNIGILDEYKTIIVAKPRKPWTEDDKLVIDQYIMNGGSVAWFVDAVKVYEDSLANGERTYAVLKDLNLNDMFFRYGARINSDLIEDLQCALIPVNIAPAGMQPNFKPSPWMYMPIIAPNDSSVITKGINLVKAKYASSMDFVGSSKSNIKKTPLLQTSENTKIVKTPAIISLSQVNEKITDIDFNEKNKTIAAIFEGNFESIFKNRIVSNLNNGKPFEFVGNGKKARMFIASDGDIIRNDIVQRANGTNIYPLGFDRYMQQTFGNKEFAKNVIMYLSDDSGLLSIRARNIGLRLLDKEMVAINRNRIVLINTIIPPLLIIIFGIIFAVVRKHRYARKK